MGVLIVSDSYISSPEWKKLWVQAEKKMIKGIIQAWREARSTQLRRKVEDAMLRVEAAGTEMNLHACLTMADAYHVLLEQYGSFSNMSEKGKKYIAKTLAKKAKTRFDFNMGQGYGLFLLSAYIEAQILPGDDAAFVKESMETMLQAALEVKKNIDSQLEAEKNKT